jgi:nucleotide-binding universal stress UspA family protein
VGELALDDVQRHAFSRELDAVGVAQVVRREASPHAGVPALRAAARDSADQVVVGSHHRGEADDRRLLAGGGHSRPRR